MIGIMLAILFLVVIVTMPLWLPYYFPSPPFGDVIRITDNIEISTTGTFATPGKVIIIG